MDFISYEQQILNIEALAGGKNIELIDTSESERNLISEVLAEVLYKIALIGINLGIDLERIADTSLLRKKWELKKHDKSQID